MIYMIVRCLFLYYKSSSFFFFLMIRRPPRSTRTDTLFPYTTLFRSFGAHADDALAIVNQFFGADAGMQRDTTIERALDEVRGQPRTGAALIIAEPLRHHVEVPLHHVGQDRKSTRLNSSH